MLPRGAFEHRYSGRTANKNRNGKQKHGKILMAKATPGPAFLFPVGKKTSSLSVILENTNFPL